MSKWILFFISLTLAGFVGTLWYVNYYAVEVEHSTTKAQLGSISRTARGTGKVESAGDPVLLSFTFPGRLKTVKVEEGDQVQEGQVLAELDSTPLDLELAEAGGALKEAQARKEQVARKARPEELAQLQEKIKRADVEEKAAAMRLKNLEEPPAPPPAPPWRIQDAKLEIERAAHLQHEAAHQFTLLSEKTPSKDQLAVAEAKVRLAEVDLDDAVRAFELAKAESFPGPYKNMSKYQQSQLEMSIERMKAKKTLAEAELGLLKRSVSAEEKQMAADRANAGKAIYDLAVLTANRLEHPVVPPKAAEWEIQLARLALEQCQSARREAEAALVSLQALPHPEDVAAAQAAIERVQKALEQVKERLTRASLRAPCDGVVLGRFHEPGSAPAPYVPVLSIADLAHLQVRAEIPVKWAAELKPGLPVSLSSLALLNASLRGKVSRVMGVVGPKTLFTKDPSESQGGEVAVIAVQVETPEEKSQAGLQSLRSGMRLDVEIAFETRENVVIVPKGFISHERGQPMVYKAASGKGASEEAPVELGFNDGVFVEVRNGLGAGDTIVKPRLKR